MLSYAVLGPLEVRADGRPLDVRGPRLRTILALLLTQPGRVLSVPLLIDGLWNMDPPGGADKTVQTYMSRLRQALESAGGESGASTVLTRAPGYLLDVDPSAIDAVRFERLASAGRQALERGNPDVARTRLREALALWRGEAYGEFLSSAMLAAESTRLEEIRVTSLEDRIEADLAVGLGPELVADLEVALSRRPHRERLWAQLMIAQYRAGRQAEALTTFGQARATLLGELGIEPSARLREVHAMVLAQDERLASPARDSIAAALPRELADTRHEGFVGRDDDLRWLLDLSERAVRGEADVALIAGPSGVGKTRLIAEFSAVALDRGISIEYAGAESAQRAAGLARASKPAGEPNTVVVVLDDLQHADDVTCEALSHLAQTGPGPGVLVIGVLDLYQAGPDVRLAVAALRGRGATLRELSPLNRDEVASIVARYVDGPYPDSVIERILATTGGRPGRVQQAASELAITAATERVEAAAAQLREPLHIVREQNDQVVSAVIDLQRVRERRAAGRTTAAELPTEAVCPYKGLARYEAEDARYFFGRERLIAELIARMVGRPLLAVVGASGSGKSSLVRAGLLPSIAAGTLPDSQHWQQTVTTVGVTDEAAMTAALATTPERRVVVLDQFEAIFVTMAEEAARELIQHLIGAAHPDSTCKIILTLRSDYYGYCAAYPDLAGLLAANTVLIGGMSADDTRRAIEGPAEAAGLDLESGLTETLLDDVVDEPGGLPLLSTALLRLWEHRSGRTLTLATYHQLGGIRQAIGRLAEEAYGSLTADQQLTARRMFLRLAEPGDGHALVRRRAPLQEVAPDEDATARAVLDIFTGHRLLTASDGAVEVAHEALLREWPRLVEWLRDDEERRAVRRHLAASAGEWRDTGRDSAELYRGARLEAALELKQDHRDELTSDEADFIAASRAQQVRASRRTRAVIAVLAALVLITAGVGAWALAERNQAVDQASVARAARTLALSRAVLADANTVRQTDPRLALLLSVAAYRLDHDDATRGNLLQQELDQSHLLGYLPTGSHQGGLAVNPVQPTVAYSSDGSIALADTRTRKRLATLRVSTKDLIDPTFSPDGNVLATDELDRATVILWDVRTHRRLRTFGDNLGAQTLNGVRFSPDGRRIAAIADDNRVLEWNVSAPTRPTQIASRDTITGFAFSPDGRTVAVGTVTSGVFLWNERAHRLTRISRPVATDPFDTRVAFDRTGDVLAFSAFPDTVVLWDMRRHRRLGVLAGVRGELGDLAFGADDSTLAVTGDNNTIELWNIRSHTKLATLTGHRSAVEQLAFSGDGKMLAAASPDDHDISIWDASQPGGPPSLSAYRRGVTDIAYSPDGHTLASVGDGTTFYPDAQGGATVLLWNPATRGRIARLATPPATDPDPVTLSEGDVTRLVFSPDGRTLAGISAHTLMWWDLRTKARSDAVASKGRVVANGIAYRRDGRLLAVSTSNTTINLWNPITREVVGTLPGRTSAVDDTVPAPYRPLVFSPDGRLLATAATKNDVGLWDVTTRTSIRTLSGHTRPVTDVAFSPDGRVLAASSNDQTIMQWDVRTHARIATLIGHHGGVTRLAYSPDGRTLASASYDMSIILWDARSHTRLATITDDAPITSLAFSPDGRTLAADAGAQIRLWPVDQSGLAGKLCAVAGSELTAAEWRNYLPGEPFRHVCQ